MSPVARPRDPGWRTRDILRAAALVAAIYMALKLMWVGRSVLLIGFFGVLLGIVLAAGVDRLERFRIPRVVGAVLILLVFGGSMTGLGLLIAPQIGRQVGELQQQIPRVLDGVERWVQQRAGGVAEMMQPAQGQTGQRSPPAESRSATGSEGAGQSRGAAQGGQAGEDPPVSIRQGLTQQLAGAGRHFFAVFSSTLSVLGGLIIILFVAVFVAVDPGLYHAGLMHLFPHRARRKAGEVLSATATTLRRWMVMQLIAMLAIGVVTTVVLLLLGIKAAIALGIIAGLLEFIPYLGPILSAVPAIAMAVVDGPDKAIYVIIAYVAIQQLEGSVIQPLLMKEGLDIPPVLTILGQALLSLVLGFLGLMLAVPILATIMVPVKMLYVRDVVGDDVSVAGEKTG
ncbi:MAG TPA: AI-2E family transporter [Gemmatimonadales bacterium]|jgi:predicted PurR-regulated permease PerM